MTIHSYDVVVVGGGPAGSRAALAASQTGCKVLMVDARTRPGQPVQCAEYVPNQVKSHVPGIGGAVIQKIDTLVTYIHQDYCSTLAGPGYILDRSTFDAALIKQAMEQGADYWGNTRAVIKTSTGLIVNRSREMIDIRCQVIIGADGPRSTVGQWVNSVNREFIIGLQYNLALPNPQSSTDVYFQSEFRGGYAWIFPKGLRANVGVGVHLAYHQALPALLDQFVYDLAAQGRLRDMKPRCKTAGLIPIGGPLTRTHYSNVLLAGDAAGLTHPVTGGGIMNAIVSGQIAGQTAAEAVLHQDLDRLSEYPQRWQDLLGDYLDRGKVQRRLMDQQWCTDHRDFGELVRKTWMGCA